MKFSKRISKVFDAIQAATIKSDRKPEFRASGLPYCPLLFISDTLESQKTAKENDFSSEFYFASGTAIHELIQRFAKRGIPDNIIGDWKCGNTLSLASKNDKLIISKCDVKREFSSFSDLDDVPCPHHKGLKCKHRMEYAELNIEYEKLTGHVDMLLWLNDKYYVVDIKTTSEFLFDKPKVAKKMGYYPSAKYIEQVESYCALLEIKYSIKIAGYAIMYVSRTKTTDKKRISHIPFVFDFTPQRRNARLKLLRRQASNHNLALKFLRKPSKKLITLIDKHKPCATRKDYLTNEMPSHFFGKEQCPYFSDFSCHNGRLKKRLVKQAKRAISKAPF